MSLAKLVKVMQTYGAYEVFNQLSWISILFGLPVEIW